jgi:signal transduction histidine kinase
VDATAVRARADALARELGDLSHAVSHDLRSPLLTIDGLAALARVARAEPAVARVDVSALAAEAVARLRAAEPDRQVQVRLEPGIAVEGDPQLVRLVVDELLDNAWTFSRGGETARIEVRAVPGDGGPVVSVSDNGVGFAPERAESLFAPFAALHPGRGSSGTGTGLAACRRAVALHGAGSGPRARPAPGRPFRSR